MCVDLIVSQYIARIHYFGRKLGVAKQRAKEAMTAIGLMWRSAAGIAALNFNQMTTHLLLNPGAVPRDGSIYSFTRRGTPVPFLPRGFTAFDFADMLADDELRQRMLARIEECERVQEELENTKSEDMEHKSVGWTLA